MTLEEQVRQDLFEMRDAKYQEFQSSLMPTMDGKKVIGVRIPQIRAYVRELRKRKDWRDYLKILPHEYYEENNVHAFLIASMRDYDECIEALDAFLPYVDNWSTCDAMSPKIFKNHLPELLEPVKRWMASGKTYTVRFGIEMLMKFYLGDAFVPEYLEWVGNLQVNPDDYYLNLIVAWYFSAALAKQWDAAIPWIEQKRLPVWVHNKTIQKSNESYRITAEQKKYIKQFKISVK